jgi:uncharacterized protein (DUF2062 family)
MSFEARAFFRARLVEPVRRLLLQGLAPDRIALTLAIGLLFAIFPIIGATTLFCTIAALALRLNMPLIQTVNHLSAPLQLVLIIPFIRLGEAIFRATPLRLSLAQMLRLAAAEPGRAIRVLWISGLYAVAAWTLTAPLAAAALYFILRPVLRATGRRLRLASEKRSVKKIEGAPPESA